MLATLRLTLLTLLLGTPLAAVAEQEWRFRVWLDDKEIGRHAFQVTEAEGQSRVRSEADFEYRVLFLTLYDYEHRNTETWRDGCLQQIEARTEVNGEQFAVEGVRAEGGFVVNGAVGEDVLPGCVMTFAYWNPAFLLQDRLLNSQNGEYLDVTVSEPLPDPVEVRGQSVPARRFELKAGDLSIRLWYSPEDEWLALESDARGGRVLRYELL